MKVRVPVATLPGTAAANYTATAENITPFSFLIHVRFIIFIVMLLLLSCFVIIRK